MFRFSSSPSLKNSVRVRLKPIQREKNGKEEKEEEIEERKTLSALLFFPSRCDVRVSSLSLSLFSLSPKGGVFKMQKEKLLGRRKQKRNENK